MPKDTDKMESNQATVDRKELEEAQKEAEDLAKRLRILNLNARIWRGQD